MSTSWKDAAESSDAAVQNMRAGNTDLAQTHALMAIMHLLSAMNQPASPVMLATDSIPGINAAEMARKVDTRFRTPVRKPTVHSSPVPTEQGVYSDRLGMPWWRTAVQSDKPWMDLTHGHSEDRWFTDEYAAQYAPFTRMEAVA